MLFLPFGDLGIEIGEALLQRLQRRGLAFLCFARAAHKLLVSRFGSLGDRRVEPLGGLAQRREPLARTVHRLLVDFGDLADGLVHALFQRRNGRRPELGRFAFAAADRFRDARSLFAQLVESLLQGVCGRGLGVGDFATLRVELLRERIGSPSYRRESLHLAPVEIGAKRGTPLRQG